MKVSFKKICKVIGVAVLLLLAWRACAGVMEALNHPEPQISVVELPDEITYLYQKSNFLYRGWAALILDGAGDVQGLAGLRFHLFPHLIFELREAPPALIDPLPPGQGEVNWEFGERLIEYTLFHLWETEMAVICSWPGWNSPTVWLAGVFAALSGALFLALAARRQ